jgi:phosphoribosylanthranilate isomerase
VKNRPLVKICGLTRPDDALAAARSGADFLGMVFAAGSKRRVDERTAKEIVSFVRGRIREMNARRAQTPQCGPADMVECPRFVGVFANEEPATMNRCAIEVGLDLVQLHGDENPSVIGRLDRPAIRAMRIGTSMPDVSVWEKADWMLFDAAAGGSGESFDWSLLRGVERRFLLAGGLTPDNVAEALSVTGAAGADVASGVESAPGVKDKEKVRRFIEAARSPRG